MEKTTLNQLIEGTAVITCTPKKQAERIVRAFIGELQLNLASGTIRLRGKS